MKESRTKLIIKYVLPTILSQCAFFLFTIIDGIFVGHDHGFYHCKYRAEYFS